MNQKRYRHDELEAEIQAIDKELQNIPEQQTKQEEIKTGWSNVPSLKDLKSDLDNAAPYRDEHTLKINHWENLLNPSKDPQSEAVRNSKERPRSRVKPKLIRKMAEWRYSFLSEPFLSNNQLFTVSPVTWEDRELANKSAILLNHQFQNNLNLIRFINEYIQTLVDEGTVILKPEWHTETVTKTVPVYEYHIRMEPNEGFEGALEVALDYYENSPSDFYTKIPEELRYSAERFLETGNLLEYEKSFLRYEEREELVKNHPTASIFSVKDVYIDPAVGTDYKKAKFIIYKFESCIADLQRDGRYLNLDAIDPDNSNATRLSDDEALNANFNFQDRARKRINVYEYWGYYDIDGTNNLKPIVVTWVDDVIIRMSESPYGDGLLPFIMVQYMPIKGTPYGEPDAVLLEDNQEINGAVVRGIIDIIGRNANGQRGIPKGMLDSAQLVRFQKGDDYVYNPTHSPDQIRTAKFEEIPNSAFQMLQVIQEDSESLTGVKGYHQGLSETSLGRVATSVRGVLYAASKRESNILRRVAEGLEELGRRFLAMNRDFLDDVELIRITNDRFEPIYREEIPEEYDITLSITTAEETAARSQELAFMLQTMAPSLDPSITMILLEEYARINKMPDVAYQIKNFNPEPDPMQEQMAMLQMQEYALRVEQAKLNLDSTAIEQAYKHAQAMHEEAKANKVMGEAQSNEINTFEQMAGIKHQRDVERIQSQAQGNIVLEERKAQLRAEETRRKELESYLRGRDNV